jgi:rhomboid-like protein
MLKPGQLAGVFSSLVSHVVNAKFRYPKYVAQLASPAAAPRKTDTWASAVSATVASSKGTATSQAAAGILPSLGASGAIYSCVAITALAFPESQVALFIPPTYPIPIQWGVGGLLALDIVGILRGWRSVNTQFITSSIDSHSGCLIIGRTWEELLLASHTTTMAPPFGK